MWLRQKASAEQTSHKYGVSVYVGGRERHEPRRQRKAYAEATERGAHRGRREKRAQTMNNTQVDQVSQDGPLYFPPSSYCGAVFILVL